MNIIAEALFTVMFSAIPGFLIFHWVSPGRKSESAVDHGRKWAAWASFIVTLATLNLFRGGIDGAITWLVCLVVFGFASYAVGWVVGKVGFSSDRSNARCKQGDSALPTNTSSMNSAYPAETAEGRLTELRILLEKELITEDEYDSKRKDIINSL